MAQQREDEDVPSQGYDAASAEQNETFTEDVPPTGYDIGNPDVVVGGEDRELYNKVYNGDVEGLGDEGLDKQDAASITRFLSGENVEAESLEIKERSNSVFFINTGDSQMFYNTESGETIPYESEM